MAEKTIILNNKQILQKMDRMAYQIYENYYNENELIIAGIAPDGEVLAKKILEKLEAISNIKVTYANIILNKNNPLSDPVKLSINKNEFENKHIIIVDDVLNSGLTMMYAINKFLETTVKSIKTLVLVDRSHKRYPIKVDFVGLSLSTTLQEHVQVSLDEGNYLAYLID